MSFGITGYNGFTGNGGNGGGGGGGCDITTLTYADFLAAYNAQTLTSCRYYVTGCSPLHYGGTTIFLNVENNKVESRGYGIFYNPKYNQSIAGFGIWNINYPTYTYDCNSLVYSPFTMLDTILVNGSPLYIGSIVTNYNDLVNAITTALSSQAIVTNLGGNVFTIKAISGNTYGDFLIDATRGVQQVVFSTNVIGTDPTGLANDATIYTANIDIDGVSNPISITGSTAQTFADLTTQISLQMIGGAATYLSNYIQIYSNTYGTGSTIVITDTNLFSSLNNYSSIDPSYNGLNAQDIAPTITTYNIGDKVIWGGYVWQNLTGSVGYSTDTFNLDGTDWQLIPYNTTDYNVVFDEVEFDVYNNWIVSRKEANSENYVSQTYEYYFQFSNDNYNSIKVFQWGNEFNASLNVGLASNTIDESIFDCINFIGASILSNILTQQSYILFNNFGLGSFLSWNTLNEKSNIQSNTITNNSGLEYNNLSSASYINNNRLDTYSTISYNNLINGSAIDYNTLFNYSYIYYNSLSNQSYFLGNTLTNDSYFYACSASEEGYYQSNNLDANSYFEACKAETSGYYNSNTLTNNSYFYSCSASEEGSYQINNLNKSSRFDSCSISTGYIGNNTLTNASNFYYCSASVTGSFQDNSLDGGSYFETCNAETGGKFSGNTLTNNSYFQICSASEEGSYQINNLDANSSFQDCKAETTGYYDSNTLSGGSFIVTSSASEEGIYSNNSLDGGSYFEGNKVTTGSQIIYNNLFDGCYIVYNQLSNQSSIDSNSLYIFGRPFPRLSSIENNLLSSRSSITTNTLSGSVIVQNQINLSAFISSQSLTETNYSNNILNNIYLLFTNVTSSITNLQAMGCSANLTDDLSSATIIYGTYTRNIIIDSTSTPKITYIDGTGTLIVGAINS